MTSGLVHKYSGIDNRQYSRPEDLSLLPPNPRIYITPNSQFHSLSLRQDRSAYKLRPRFCNLRTMSEANNNKASKSAEEASLDARQQQLSSYGSTDPPPAYSPHDETSPTDNTAAVSGFRAGFNALTSAISKTFCGAGSAARTSSDEKPMGEAKTLHGTGAKDKRPNKNCVGCVLHTKCIFFCHDDFQRAVKELTTGLKLQMYRL